jgi:hypothetical protein
VTLRVASSVLVLQPPGHGLEPQAPRHLMAKDSDARACARSCTCPLLGTLFGSRSLVSWNHLSFVRSPDSYYNSESRLIPVPVGLNFLLQVDRSNLSLILVDRTVASPKSGVFGLASIGRSPGPAGAIRPRQGSGQVSSGQCAAAGASESSHGAPGRPPVTSHWQCRQQPEPAREGPRPRGPRRGRSQPPVTRAARAGDPSGRPRQWSHVTACCYELLVVTC